MLLDVKNVIVKPLRPEYLATFYVHVYGSDSSEDLAKDVSYKAKLAHPIHFRRLFNETYQTLREKLDGEWGKTVEVFAHHFGLVDQNNTVLNRPGANLQLPLKDAYATDVVVPGQIWSTDVILSLLQDIVTTPAGIDQPSKTLACLNRNQCPNELHIGQRIF